MRLAALLAILLSSVGYSQAHTYNADFGVMFYNGQSSQGADALSIWSANVGTKTGTIRPIIGVSKFTDSTSVGLSTVGGLTWWPTLLGSYGVVGGHTSIDGGKILSNSIGFSTSQWMFDERYEVALSFTKAFTNQPPKRFLDIDAKLVEIPGYVTSDELSINQKFLVNTTQTISLNYYLVEPSNRPLRSSVGLNTSKYLVQHRTALHFGLGWLVDHKQVERTTNYGKIDSKHADFQVYHELQHDLTLGALLRTYFEKETPRYSSDAYIFGSDTVGVNVKYIIINAGVYRYLNNRKANGVSVEAGIEADF